MEAPSRKGVVYSLVFSLFWALQIFLDKIAFRQGGASSPQNYIFYVLVFSTAALTLLASRPGGRTEIFSSVKHNFGRLVLLAVVSGAASLTSILAIKLTSSVNYSFLVKTTIVLVPLFSAIFLGEVFTGRKGALVLAFLLGIYLLSTGGGAIVPVPGDMIALLAALLYATGTVLQKSVASKISPLAISWVRQIVPLLIFGSIFILIEGPDFLVPEAILFAIPSGILNALIVFFLAKALKEASATFVSMVSMSVPVFNAVLGAAFLSEALGPVQAAGAAIILGSGAFLMLSSGKM